MKLPAVAIAAAFAGGILLGIRQLDSAPHNAAPFVAAMLCGAFLLIVVGCWLTWRQLVWPAAILSLVAWMDRGSSRGVWRIAPFLRGMS